MLIDSMANKRYCTSLVIHERLKLNDNIELKYT